MYEADQRHAGVCSKDMGVNEDSIEANAPADSSSKDSRFKNIIVDAEKDDELLSSSGPIEYSGMVARMNRLGQDRRDIQLVVKEPRKNEFAEAIKLA